jgi:hypothetical protein
MTNLAYLEMEQALMAGRGPALASPSIEVKAQLIALEHYTFSDEHRMLADIPPAARCGSPVALTNRSVARTTRDGMASETFFANSVTLTPSSSVAKVDACILYVEGADDARSPLLLYIDNGHGRWPFSVSGDTVTIVWNWQGIYSYRLDDVPTPSHAEAMLT